MTKSGADGYAITTASRRALEEFRKTLPPAGSELRLCPPDCAETHRLVRVVKPRPGVEPIASRRRVDRDEAGNYFIYADAEA